MKLNPKKCAFEVQSGKFMGFMITQRGIKANPNKVQAIFDMALPRTPMTFKADSEASSSQQILGKVQ